MLITSNSNEKIKEIKKLYDKKYRTIEQKYIIEGIKIVEEAYLQKQDFASIVICQEILDGVSINKENIEKLISEKESIIIETTKNVFESISDIKTPQGIIGVLKINKPIQRTYSDSIVFLDNVQDAGNVGTIIRSARAFNFNTIILNKGCVDIYNEKVLRSTMGNIFNIEHYELVDNGVNEIKKLKELGYNIYCTTLEKSKSILDTEFTNKKVLVIGNEANGISAEVLSLTSQNITIPMYNNTESLNASVAASIAMYEINKNKEV